LLDVVLEQPHGEKFVTLALTSTDERVRAGKPVSPSFLFATLLWHDVQTRWQKYTGAGEFPVPALHRAMDDVLEMQTEKLAIHKRYSADMREIWGLQHRLEKRGRSALKLLEHPRFRAGYDFLLLRCESGELDAEVGQWWTDFIESDHAQREMLLAQGGKDHNAPKKRRRRSNAKRKTGEAAELGVATEAQASPVSGAEQTSAERRNGGRGEGSDNE
jgi:poly(A) polymerase